MWIKSILYIQVFSCLLHFENNTTGKGINAFTMKLYNIISKMMSTID